MAAWVLPVGDFLRVVFRAFGAIGQYNQTKPTLADGEGALLQLDTDGSLIVVPAAGAVWVVGGPGLQDAAINNAVWRPVEVSYEANAYTLGTAFAPNVPVGADGDVVRPRASRYGVPYAMLVSQNGEHTVQIFGGQANPAPDEPTYGIPPMAIRRDTPTALEANDKFIPLTTDAQGALWVALDPTMAPMYAEDAGATSGDRGIFTLGVRNDAQIATTDANRDYSELSVTQYGALWVQLASAAGGPVFAEDAAHTSGDRGIEMLAVRRDVCINSAGSDGDYSVVNLDADGYLYQRGKEYDAASNAARSLPVTDLSAHRTPGDAPIPLIAAAQTITNAWVDLGPELPLMGDTRVRLWLYVTKGDGTVTTVQVRCLAKHTNAGADEYPQPIKSVNTGGAPFTITEDDEVIYPFNTDATARRTDYWDVDNTIPWVQFQIQATAPGTTMVVTSAYATYGWA